MFEEEKYEGSSHKMPNSSRNMYKVRTSDFEEGKLIYINGTPTKQPGFDHKTNNQTHKPRHEAKHNTSKPMSESMRKMTAKFGHNNNISLNNLGSSSDNLGSSPLGKSPRQDTVKISSTIKRLASKFDASIVATPTSSPKHSPHNCLPFTSDYKPASPSEYTPGTDKRPTVVTPKWSPTGSGMPDYGYSAPHSPEPSIVLHHLRSPEQHVLIDAVNDGNGNTTTKSSPIAYNRIGRSRMDDISSSDHNKTGTENIVRNQYSISSRVAHYEKGSAIENKSNNVAGRNKVLLQYSMSGSNDYTIESQFTDFNQGFISLIGSDEDDVPSRLTEVSDITDSTYSLNPSDAQHLEGSSAYRERQYETQHQYHCMRLTPISVDGKGIVTALNTQYIAGSEGSLSGTLDENPTISLPNLRSGRDKSTLYPDAHHRSDTNIQQRQSHSHRRDHEREIEIEIETERMIQVSHHQHIESQQQQIHRPPSSERLDRNRSSNTLYKDHKQGHGSDKDHVKASSPTSSSTGKRLRQPPNDVEGSGAPDITATAPVVCLKNNQPNQATPHISAKLNINSNSNSFTDVKEQEYSHVDDAPSSSSNVGGNLGNQSPGSNQSKPSSVNVSMTLQFFTPVGSPTSPAETSESHSGKKSHANSLQRHGSERLNMAPVTPTRHAKQSKQGRSRYSAKGRSGDSPHNDDKKGSWMESIANGVSSPVMSLLSLSHIGEKKHHVSFGVIIRQLNFTRNDCFIAKSNYFIFAGDDKKVKGKPSWTKRFAMTMEDLRNMKIDEMVFFNASLYQPRRSMPVDGKGKAMVEEDRRDCNSVKSAPFRKKLVKLNIRQISVLEEIEDRFECMYKDIGFIELDLSQVVCNPTHQSYSIALSDKEDLIDGTMNITIKYKFVKKQDIDG